MEIQQRCQFVKYFIHLNSRWPLWLENSIMSKFPYFLFKQINDVDRTIKYWNKDKGDWMFFFVSHGLHFKCKTNSIVTNAGLRVFIECLCESFYAKQFGHVQYIPRNMHTVFALLCFVVVIHWLIFPHPSGLLHWHCGNLTISPVPAKQP